ncbi:hypothetical protein ACJZ2D_003944 [Fusarium nematophilum]
MSGSIVQNYRLLRVQSNVSLTPQPSVLGCAKIPRILWFTVEERQSDAPASGVEGPSAGSCTVLAEGWREAYGAWLQNRPAGNGDARAGRGVGGATGTLFGFRPGPFWQVIYLMHFFLDLDFSCVELPF